MAKPDPFEEVFRQLKDILKKYAPALVLQEDRLDSYSLNTPYTERYQKELFFGAAQIKKRYVSYYLMPVYMFPDLLQDITPELRTRMQGKSCFNFTSARPELFQELAQLTQQGYDRLKEEKLIA
jgi:hypothetical protein